MEGLDSPEQRPGNPEIDFIDPTTFPQYSENDKRILREVEAKIYPKERKGMVYKVPTIEELKEQGVASPELLRASLEVFQNYLKARALRDKFGADEDARDKWKEGILYQGTPENQESLKTAYGKDNQFRDNAITPVTGRMQLLLRRYFNPESEEYAGLRARIGDIQDRQARLKGMVEEASESRKNKKGYDSEPYYEYRLRYVQTIEDMIMDLTKALLPPGLLRGEEVDIT